MPIFYFKKKKEKKKKERKKRERNDQSAGKTSLNKINSADCAYRSTLRNQTPILIQNYG